jgi:deoxyribonuclease-4
VYELRQAGNPVILRPETMGKTAMLGSFEDTLIMSQEIEGVEPCLDFAHLHARAGDGSMNTAEEWRQLMHTYEKSLGGTALERLHIHLSGIEYSIKGERNHLPLSEADIDYRAIFYVLNEFKASGRILCESPAMEEDALIMKKAWEEITIAA